MASSWTKSCFNWRKRSSLEGMSAADLAESRRQASFSVELGVIVMPTMALGNPSFWFGFSVDSVEDHGNGFGGIRERIEKFRGLRGKGLGAGRCVV